MAKSRKSCDEYWSEMTESYHDMDDVDIDAVSVNMSVNSDKKKPTRFTKFVQFFILSIGIAYTTIANTPIFLLLFFHYGWFKVNETSFNRGFYIFETLTYFQYLNIGKFVIVFEVFLAIIIMMLSFWSFVKKRDTRKNGIICMCLYTIASLGLLGFFIYNWAQEEQKLLDMMYDGFNRLFVRHFVLGNQHFEDLKYFMDTRKCCGPNGTLDFLNNMDIANELYMPPFCHNSTNTEYNVGCYDKFTNINRNMFDEALGYIIVTSIGVTMATVLIYRLFMKSASILPKIDRKKNRANIKRVFNNSYVGRKINEKFKK